jgi:hypothetical protein
MTKKKQLFCANLRLWPIRNCFNDILHIVKQRHQAALVPESAQQKQQINLRAINFLETT